MVDDDGLLHNTGPAEATLRTRAKDARHQVFLTPPGPPRRFPRSTNTATTNTATTMEIALREGPWADGIQATLPFPGTPPRGSPSQRSQLNSRSSKRLTASRMPTTKWPVIERRKAAAEAAAVRRESFCLTSPRRRGRPRGRGLPRGSAGEMLSTNTHHIAVDVLIESSMGGKMRFRVAEAIAGYRNCARGV